MVSKTDKTIGKIYHFCLLLMIAIILTYCRKNTELSHIKKRNIAGIETTGLDSINNPDFSSILWGTAKGMPVATHEVQGEAVNGKLYIFGGFDIYKRPNYWSPTKRAYVYDPLTDVWTPIADLPHLPNGPDFGGISNLGLTNDGTDIYFAGGYTSNYNGTGQIFGTKQVWKYNVASNTYTRLPDLPQALAAGQMRYLNGRIHYMGGANLAREDVNIHLVLDLNNLSAGWQPLAPLLNGVNHPGSVVFNGKIYLMGGSHLQDEHAIVQKTLEVYDDANDSWTQLADMSPGRDHIVSSVIAIGNQILVLGGERAHNILSNRVSAYSPATNTWTELTPLTVVKSSGVGVELNGNIYYVGGNFSITNRKGVFPGTTATTPVPILPDADAHIRSGKYSATNYGSDSVMTVKTAHIDNYTRGMYFKFSLADISKMTSATLRIYGFATGDTTAVNLSCYGVDDDSWIENAITFDNSPAISTSLLSTSTVTNQPTYLEFDVTSYVQTQLAGDKVVTLLIKDDELRNIKLFFNSRENSVNKPVLVVQ